MHIVSNVEGCLKEGVTNMDILAATFPAGTLSARQKSARWKSSKKSNRRKRGIYAAPSAYGASTTIWIGNRHPHRRD
ncbi:chorismate-binding protein [Neisseria gonorrhoeae]